MKLKRLIAITVALATILSCSCVTGITVSAAYTMGDVTEDTVLNVWNGKIGSGATAGVQYGLTAKNKYTADGVAYTSSALAEGLTAVVGGITDTDHSNTAVMSLTMASAGYNTGAIAYHAYADGADKPESDTNGYYYDVSYGTLRNTSEETYTGLTEDVLSIKYEVCAPSTSASGTSNMFFKCVSYDGTTEGDDNYPAMKMLCVYDANTQTAQLYPAKHSKYAELLWSSDPVVVPADTWHTVELRYTHDGNSFIMGGYVDGTQVYCAKLDDTKSSLICGQLDLVNANTTTNPGAIKTYYDEIVISLLDGKDDAPLLEKPAEPTLDEYLWGHYDMDNAPETGVPVYTTSDSVYSKRFDVSGSSNVEAVYTVEDDAVYGGKALKQSVAVSELTEDNYHRFVSAFREFFTKHNGIDGEVVTEYAVDIKVPSEDINAERTLMFVYPAGDSKDTQIKSATIVIENGRISAWDSEGTAGYVADVADAQISKPMSFTADVWHKVRVLNYYNYNAAEKYYDVKVQALCDNYIIFENQFVYTQPEGFEENFGVGLLDFRTFSSTENTVETYFGDITIKSFINDTYDDSAFDWYKDPNRVEYSAVREDTKVTVTANIYGNEGVTGDACMVVAVFGADGKVIKLVPTAVTLPEAVDGCRTISAELTNDGVVAGNKVRAFLFDTLISAKPLIPSYVGTLK